MKTQFLFCISLLFFTTLSAQSDITEAEARAFTQRYLDTLLYNDGYSELEAFFTGDFEEEEAMSLSYFFFHRYKIQSVQPPWVTVLANTEDPGRWDRQYRFYLVKERDSLFFVPEAQRQWLADMALPYQDETVISMPYSSEDRALIRDQLWAEIDVEDTSSLDRSHPGLIGRWFITQSLQEDNLPYRHWSKSTTQLELKEGGEFGDEGEWFVANDKLMIYNSELSRYEQYDFEFLADGSLWLSHEGAYGDMAYLHLARAEKYDPVAYLEPRLLPPGVEVLVQPQYEDLTCFINGLAKVSFLGKMGFLNEKGQLAIPARYDKATHFNDSGQAFCNLDGGAVVIDTSGNILSRFGYEIDFQWITGDYFIRKEGKRGIADSLGQFVLEPVYDDIKPGSFTHYQVLKDNKWGIWDIAGNLVLPIEYEGLEQRTEQLAIIKKGMKYGVMDIESKELIVPIVYERIKIKGGPLILAYTEDKAVPFRMDGSRLSGMEYDHMEWMGWYYFGVEKDGKRGIINEKGETVLPIKYDDVMWYDLDLKGVFETTTDGETVVRDSTERILSPKELQEQQRVQEAFEQLKEAYEEGTAPSALHVEARGNYYGYFNLDGEMVIPPLYDYAFDFENGKAVVEKEGFYGMIDESGDTILPFIFGYLGQCHDSNFWQIEYKGKYGLLRMRP